MANVGEVAVKILLDAKDAAKEAQTFSNSISSSLNKLGSATESIGKSLTSHITKPAIAAATAVAGIFIVKGWDRLLNIDTAKAKLTALGYSAEEVASAMDSARTSVLGTKYSLDAAATAAAAASAAGVAMGNDMTRYLSLMADAAAIGNVSLEDMSAIFNKVQASTKAYTMELNQLTSQGIPIIKWLADECNVTQEAIYDMASNGEISAEMFFNAIEKNIGGAAKLMGSLSLAATFDNIWAAVGRVGASFLNAGGDADSLFSIVKRGAENFLTWISGMEDEAAQLGRLAAAALQEIIDGIGRVLAELGITIPSFGEISISVEDVHRAVSGFFDDVIQLIRDMKERFRELPQPLQDFLTKLAPFAPAILLALGPVLQIFGKIISGVGSLVGIIGSLSGAASGVAGALGGAFAGALGPILAVIAAVAALVALFIYFWNTSESFREFFTNLWEGLKLAFANFAETVSGKFEEVKEKVAPVLERLQIALDKLEPVLEVIGGLLGGTLVVALGLLAGVIDEVLSMIEGMIELFTGVIEVVAGVFDLVVGLLEGDQVKIDQAVEMICQGINDILSGLYDLTIGAIESYCQGVISYFIGLSEDANGIFGDMTQDISVSFGLMSRNVFKTSGELTLGVVDLFSQMSTGVRISTGELTGAVVGFFAWLGLDVTKISENICTTVSESTDQMSQDLSDGLSLMQATWEGVWTVMGTILSDAWAVFGVILGDNLASTQSNWEETWGGIEQFFTDVWDGIKQGAADGVEVLYGTVTGVKDMILEFFANSSTWLYEAGQAIISGLTGGVEASFDGLTGLMSGIGPMIASVKGPKEYDLKLLRPAGGWIMQGLTESIKDETSGVLKEVSSIGPKLANIDWYAQGGVYNRPPVIGIGENGSNSVLPPAGPMLAENTERPGNVTNNYYTISNMSFEPESKIAQLIDNIFAEAERLNIMEAA